MRFTPHSPSNRSWANLDCLLWDAASAFFMSLLRVSLSVRANSSAPYFRLMHDLLDKRWFRNTATRQVGIPVCPRHLARTRWPFLHQCAVALTFDNHHAWLVGIQVRGPMRFGWSCRLGWPSWLWWPSRLRRATWRRWRLYNNGRRMCRFPAGRFRRWLNDEGWCMGWLGGRRCRCLS